MVEEKRGIKGGIACGNVKEALPDGDCRILGAGTVYVYCMASKSNLQAD